MKSIQSNTMLSNFWILKLFQIISATIFIGTITADVYLSKINNHINSEPHISQLVQIEILDSNLNVKHFEENCSNNHNNRRNVRNVHQHYYDKEDVLYFRLSGLMAYDNLIVKLLSYNAENSERRPNFNVYKVDKNGDYILVDDDDDDGGGGELNEGDLFSAYGLVSNFSTNSFVYLDGHDNGCGRIRLNAFISIDGTFYYLRPVHSPSQQDNSRQGSKILHLISIESHSKESTLNYYLTPNESFSTTSNRYKRDTGMERTNCGAKIIVDYSFYSRMGFDLAKTILFVKYAVFNANNVFVNTIFTKSGYENNTLNNDVSFTGFGILLCDLVIHQNLDDNVSYNRLTNWTMKTIMDELFHSIYMPQDFCLVYLFTQNKIVGISGASATKQIFTKHNIGVVSFFGYDLYSVPSIFNFIHEIGHVFGSEHDPDDGGGDESECIPSTGGVFIMNFKPFEELGPNNMHFSPCSIRSIYQNIRNNHDYFTENCSKSCGNRIVEDGEQCDEGTPRYDSLSLVGCCDKNCHFKPNATCSRYHSGCCNRMCQIESEGAQCMPSDELTCRKNSICDGISDKCPERSMIPDGQFCIPQANISGICRGGYCSSICPDPYQKCDCPAQFVCRICCRSNDLVLNNNSTNNLTDNSDGVCTPHYNLKDQSSVFNGTNFGRCENGEFIYDEIPLEPTLPPSIPKDIIVERRKTIFNWIAISIIIFIFVLSLIFVWFLYKFINRSNKKKYLVDREPLLKGNANDNNVPQLQAVAGTSTLPRSSSQNYIGN